MDNIQAKNLLARYLEGHCSEAEAAQVETWYLQSQEYPLEVPFDLLEDDLKVVEKVIIKHAAPKRIRLWPRIAAAAAAIVICVAGGYLLLRRTGKTDIGQQNIYVNDVLPGGNKAYLTLSDGKRIALDGLGNSRLASDGGAFIERTAEGLRYDKNGEKAGTTNNSVTTPRGGEFRLMLSDGTKVWLNSASSLSYPANFAGKKDRRVKLSGEGYFEVAKDAEHPFLVEAGNQLVSVLGTHFNINAYEKESQIRTTLLEGAVRVKPLIGGDAGKVLTPGQQAVFSAQSIQIGSADIEGTMAWKNGYFRFEDENIESIMKKLARWYDVDVSYEGRMPSEGFNGKISKFNNISQVLNALESTHTVHFKVQGRRVTVIP